VIGILIALSINNWNDKRLNQLRADRFTEKLKLQFEDNLKRLDFLINLNESRDKQSRRLIYIMGESVDSTSELKIDSLIISNVGDFHLNLDLNILLEGRENGDLALLYSDSLRQSIYRFSNFNERVKEREQITNADLNNHFVPYLNKHYNWRNVSHRSFVESNLGPSKVYKGDNYKILSDQEFENLITTRIGYNSDLILLYQRLREILQEINDLLLDNNK